MPTERLQKILSRAGIASRRKAEILLLEGRVRVNRQVIYELGSQADAIRDKIEVDGKLLKPVQEFHYYAYYKPRGLLVTKQDELGRRGIFAELELPPAVNSVGRLDKNSEGLLLLSDDGEFVQRYTHPSFEVPKCYEVKISRVLKPGEIKQLLKGIPLEEKIAQAYQAIQWVEPGEFWLGLELREGMKREIRRMLEFFGVKVLRLIRVQHGAVKLGNLTPGEMRILKTCPKLKSFNTKY